MTAEQGPEQRSPEWQEAENGFQKVITDLRATTKRSSRGPEAAHRAAEQFSGYPHDFNLSLSGNPLRRMGMRMSRYPQTKIPEE